MKTPCEQNVETLTVEAHDSQSKECTLNC